jgi:Right handed beta helix region/Subtilase family/PKD-like domain
VKVRFLHAAVFVPGITLLLAATLPAQPLDPQAAQQIQALLQDKRGRTAAQQKVDSNLLYEAKQKRGLAVASGVPTLRTGVVVGTRGEVVLDVTASVTDSLLATIASLGGRVVNAYPAFRSIRAELPLAAVETLAGHADVLFVQPRQQAIVNRAAQPAGPFLAGGVSSSLLRPVGPGFPQRAASVRAQLSAALRRPISIAKVNTSEGVVTHRADLATSTFGVTGAGVKVGVLSDGVDSLATLQGSGDLPAGVTVLPGQAGSGDEGSAMLEIVYDMAPGAQLYFATAFNGIASFAQNIHDLRTAGCDIIIDDVGYFVETPFQEGQTGIVASNTNAGLVTQAVNDVTAAGALYFSSAANSGGKDKGTSGTFEGDFVDGGAAGAPIPEAGRLHHFGLLNYDSITASGFATTLFWSDPLGGSTNDYDLFILNSTGTAVLGASTNTQNGTQDPFEQIGGAPAGDRIVIVKVAGAGRFLHLDTNRGQLTFNTQGNTHGHNAPPSANAFSVAATPAAAAVGLPPNPTGPYPNPFNSSNQIEIFSSDGPRQYFFNADSSAITPGNFSSSGGVILQKPDITAADGVSCAAPGFSLFYGTSAAAPHAGAIAALIKSADLSLTATQISAALTSTAIDIEAVGWDRNSGAGILDAFAAVQSVVCTPPSATITAPASVAASTTGNTASVPDAGPGATYTWGITNGTITGGAGTRSITFTAGASGSVGLTITIQNADGCSAGNATSIPIVTPAARAFVSAKTGNDVNGCTLALPCRTFVRALPLIQSGGELAVLDSGGYGAFTITQAVSVVVPQGVYAGITAFSGDAITISAGSSDIVSLQGLTINALGGANGVRFASGGALSVANCSINGFADGIRAEGSGTLTVRETRLRNSTTAAIHLVPSSPSLATLIRCRLEQGASGLSVENAASVSMEENVASGNAGAGVSCAAGDVTVDDCLLAGNGTGASASGAGTLRISDSCVTDNTTGLFQSGGGTLLSRTDNTVEGNGADTTGTIGAFTPK